MEGRSYHKDEPPRGGAERWGRAGLRDALAMDHTEQPVGREWEASGEEGEENGEPVGAVSGQTQKAPLFSVEVLILISHFLDHGGCGAWREGGVWWDSVLLPCEWGEFALGRTTEQHLRS
ncbi:hypothetical protein JZ751_012362 [Albula glossodonta]|uniref:Uncharacterized protein n=1 Tax=Albula glossodonta TaxID=121402 RepID=A0A8T2PSE1_9TELE|nr:hypothetical protein JZ751_012362 [Albula glossodonta]